MELDKQRTYQAEPRDFIRVLERRTIITEKMKQQRDELHDYLKDFQDPETGRINYVDMAMDLRNFNYDLETNEGVLPRGPNSISSGAGSIAGKVESGHDDDFVVLDSQRVPQNKLEAIER